MDRKAIIRAYSPTRSTSFYITQRKNFKIESELESGDGTLSLSVPDNTYLLECEGYLRTEGQEYVIKEISPARTGFRDVTAILNFEDLEGKLYRTYEKKATAAEHLTDAVKDTGWSVRCADGGISLTISAEKTNAKKIIEQACEIFGLEVRYDTVNKILYAAQEIGSDKGVVFLKGVNLLKTEVKRDTYDYCTRLYPIGKDGITIAEANGGKDYIDVAGATKIVPQYWEDSSYETAAGLLEAAEYKLSEMSKAAVNITVKVIDLAGRDPDRFSAYAFEVGDTVNVVDGKEENGKYRVSKKTIYPDQQKKNTVQLANRRKSFADYAKKLRTDAEEADKIIIRLGRNTEKIEKQVQDLQDGMPSIEAISNIQIDAICK